MAAIIKRTALEPVVTGALLWTLLRGPPALRLRILEPLSYLPTYLQISTPTLIKVVKGLFAAGVLKRVNDLLNRWALNNWKIDSGAKQWDWPNEICVITGGSGGIGSELAKKLAPTGMKIAIIDLAPIPKSLQALSNVSYFPCDITDKTSVDRVASEIKSSIGNPTILCNNAGICLVNTILDVSSSYLEKVFHINVISHWWTVQAFLPAMIEGRKGHVVTTASMASYTAVAGFVDYCSTKAGALAFHEGLTQELKHRYNAPFVRTTSINPYWVQTPLIGDFGQQLKAKKNPIMSPEYVAGEIAKAILSGKSGHVVLPRGLMMSLATGARGWATWMHELVNDTTKEVTRKVDLQRK